MKATNITGGQAGCRLFRKDWRRATLFLTAGLLTAGCVLAGCSQNNTDARTEAPAPPLSFEGSWGVRGDGPGQLDEPVGIATDTVGNVYIADAGSRFIDKFDSRGTPLLSFQDDRLKQPESITVDSGGAIYVTDVRQHSAFVYFPNGDRYRQLRLRTRPRGEDTLGVAVSDDGLISILDVDAGQIMQYNPRFRLVRTWNPAPKTPNGKAQVEALATSSDGYIYLADPAGNRVLRFTHEGSFVAAIDGTADGTDRRLSGQFAVSPNYVFVMDTNGRMLHVWSTDGQPRLDVDLAPELGQGNRPAPPLAVSSRRELLVLDAPGARVLRYRLDIW